MRVIAAVMIAVGVLVTLLSGLCTATFSLTALASMTGRNAAAGTPLLVMALVIGAPFIAGGVGLLLGGLGLWKRQPKSPPDDVF